jgi:hypothetical protein
MLSSLVEELHLEGAVVEMEVVIPMVEVVVTAVWF